MRPAFRSEASEWLASRRNSRLQPTEIAPFGFGMAMALSWGGSRVELDQVVEPGRSVAVRLRDGLVRLLGDDLVAFWLYGGRLNVAGSVGDVDGHVVVRRELDAGELSEVRALHESVRREFGIDELDVWYVLLGEAGLGLGPRDLNWPVDVRDENWALKRAHWVAGAVVVVYGLPPAEVVVPPLWSDVVGELLTQVASAHEEVVAGGSDAVALTMRLARVLRTLVTGEVVCGKVDAARWMSRRVSAEVAAHLEASIRLYAGVAGGAESVVVREGLSGFMCEFDRLAAEFDGASWGR